LEQSYEISPLSIVKFFTIFDPNIYKMKRVISLLVLALFLNSCDDGNLTLENIDFDDVSTQSCTTNDIIYKLKDQEALLLEIPETAFVNEPTVEGKPTLINIDNATYRVVYRFYNGTIATNNICNTIPPATPIVTDQWTVTSGTIQIITTAVKAIDATTNSSRITGYNHNINFSNITFERAGGDQKYATFPFGDYVTKPINDLPLAFDKQVELCTTSPRQLYNYVNGESLTIDNIDATLIQNVETPLNTPRTAIIGTTNNMLIYRLYSGVLDANDFCTSNPTLPAVKEQWNGVAGISGVSGIIEVTTIKNGTSAYKHTIVIRKGILKKGNSDFSLGDSYVYGEVTTTN
jgi:PBP1b-binding outer membrane lipoprotein LpoB